MKRLIVLVLLCSVAFAQRNPTLPDPVLTPGEGLAVPLEKLCKVGYTKTVRNVTEKMERQVFRLYKIDFATRAEYEVDHLVSLQLGGTNAIRNLFPQPYVGEWGARKKDGLEHRLGAFVCNGKLELRTAQMEIATDWIAAYKKYFPEKAGAK